MDFKFDKQAHIAKMKPSTNKLIKYFVSKGVEFNLWDNGNENVVLKYKDQIMKISHHCFYRYSGLSVIYREKGETTLESVKVTDEMFMMIFMRSYIESYFTNLN